MPNSLQSEPVRDLLGRLFKAAEGDDLRRVRVAMAHPDGFGPVATREQADAYEEIYIPVSPEAVLRSFAARTSRSRRLSVPN